MSEAIRSYRPPRRSGYDAPASTGGTLRWVVALLLFLGMVWFFWTTRDNWPMERLVPRDQAFQLRAEHLLATRQKAAASAFWDLGMLPEKYHDIPKWLGSDFGLPGWVINNLVSDVCYVSGKDLNAYSDLLVVTRMSRIGCLLERYYGIADDIVPEYAGGLRLRHMDGLGAYYAVRGRTLVFSPSRDALIRALTLHEDDAVETLAETVAPIEGDIQGRIALDDNTSLGKFLTQTDFGLRFEAKGIVMSGRGTVTPAWRAQLDKLVAGGNSAGLKVPAKGSFVVAGDLNTPLPAVWTAINEMTDGALVEFARESMLFPDAPDTNPAWGALLEGLKGDLGSGFAVRCTGFDHNGIVPVPEADLFIETRSAAAGTLLGAVPELPAGQATTEFVPFRQATSGIVRCPVGWGGVFEPAFFADKGGIRMALHPDHLEHALAMDRTLEQVPDAGHLYMRIIPGDVLELLRDGGKIYAESGLLRGYTPASFEEAMLAARAGSRQISEIRAAASYKEGAILVEVIVQLAEDVPPAEAETPQDAPNTATE